ncbi:MAG: hypothetical protein ACI379_13895 [Nocardioides sp.]|uniref:hypothetical protein n=1 Tax=Nocardioides sp. TaxID=35761 RepID=UPI003F01F0B6
MTTEPAAYDSEPLEAAPSGQHPPLPGSIWVVAWASLAGQAVALLDRGTRSGDETGMLLSVVLGAVIVGYVSAGVVRARPIRVALAWLVLVLSGGGELFLLLSGDTQDELVGLALVATSVVAIAALWSFCLSDWYAWQRGRPSTGLGESIGGLVLIAVVVGVLGGMAAPAENGIQLNVRVAGP